MSEYLLLFFTIFFQFRAEPRNQVEISQSVASPQAVGKPIVWSARYPGTKISGVNFRWSVAAGGGLPRVVRDYGAHRSFTYAPLAEGPYVVLLSVRDAEGNVVASATSPYVAKSLVGSGGTPKVTATAHPLVALYSTRCQAGNVRVRFVLGAADISTGMATPFFPCAGVQSVNIPVAGMRASSTYRLQEEVDAGLTRTAGPVLSFQTGRVSAVIPVPAALLKGQPQSPEPVILSFFINLYGTQPQCPIAYDTAGNVIWYYLDPDLGVDYVYRLLPGGNILGTTDYNGQVLREVDLMGNLVRETTSQRVGEQMQALGYPKISQFSHDAIRLANGYTAVIATIEQLADQGQGVVDVLGDAVVVLDKDWQVSWVWNAFQELDVKRPSTSNDVCLPLTNGCPALALAGIGAGWARWLELRLTGRGARIAGWVWPVCFLICGVVLLIYREA